MTTKTDFDVEEWNQLLAMPWIAGLLVIVADPSFRMVGELKAMATAVLGGASPGAAQDLIGELVADTDDVTDAPEPEADGEEGEAEMLEALRQCGGLLAERCSVDEAEHVRRWVIAVATATAEARREGGFLGIGAVRVSDDERSAISKVESALAG